MNIPIRLIVVTGLLAAIIFIMWLVSNRSVTLPDISISKDIGPVKSIVDAREKLKVYIRVEDGKISPMKVIISSGTHVVFYNQNSYPVVKQIDGTGRQIIPADDEITTTFMDRGNIVFTIDGQRGEIVVV